MSGRVLPPRKGYARLTRIEFWTIYSAADAACEPPTPRVPRVWAVPPSSSMSCSSKVGGGRFGWGCELRQNWPMPILNKDMSLCISLSGRPSNIGTRFHNYLYDEIGLNFIYKAFSTDDIAGAMAGVRALGIRGCSV